MRDILTLKDASQWASHYIGKNVTPSNISYLVQYGKIAKVNHNGNALVNKQELQDYYDTAINQQQAWQSQLGEDLNWHLSFAEYKEAETTKHVHRLHPYKGKFIPQLVEYFLDSHTDKFKRQSFFQADDIILDPFCGSGTTLVQANELGMHAIGIDVSAFNAFISNVKLAEYDIASVQKLADNITEKLKHFPEVAKIREFDTHLSESLKAFNARYFPAPSFRHAVRKGEINEKTYGSEKAELFMLEYQKLVNQYQVSLLQNSDSNFLEKWFLKPLRSEIDFIFDNIQQHSEGNSKKILALILSRTMRSCRATTHADLGTLRQPVQAPYYCKKHGKICKPLLTSLNWWQRYSQDTLARLAEFGELRTSTKQICLTADSRSVDIVQALQEQNHKLAAQVQSEKIAGIFSSPPYVGLIDYHEQHAYAYDLFGFSRRNELEIGPLCKGQSRAAQQDYMQGVSGVLSNSRTYLQDDYNVFLVANDKYGLYPEIANLAGMRIVNEYKRPVLNRVEKDRSAYAEKIFHLQEK